MACLALAGCATTQPQTVNDPLEPVNRAVFAFNNTVDGMFLEPAAIMYRDFIPEFGRLRIRNFLANLREPVTFVNQMLQGKGGEAVDTFGRFATNTTLGVGGLFDVGTEAGLPRVPQQDFGLTLGTYGVAGGPYLMLPVLGPSNPRDLTGRLVDALALSPVPEVLGYGDQALAVAVVQNGAETVDFRSQNIESFRELKETSVDLYATVRSAYLQRRAALIRGDGETGGPADDSLYDDPLASPE
jgi:phospholipid-binding lipoprotein MlaA